MTQVRAVDAVVGEAVLRRRTDLGLTQDGLARLLRATGVGWTAVTVAKVETGRRRVSAGDLVALGLALGLMPAELLDSPGRVTLGRTDSWVPADAVSTWARGEVPTPHQRAQWARDEGADAAPLRWLDDRARVLAAYLSHVPDERRPAQVRLSEVEAERAAVAAEVQAWEERRRRAGRPVTDAARRAKTTHAWKALHAQHGA